MILVRQVVRLRKKLADCVVYSDVEFVIPARTTRRSNPNGDQEKGSPRKIYATKKLLTRCEYFHAMFNGGFREVEGAIEDVRPSHSPPDPSRCLLTQCIGYRR